MTQYIKYSLQIISFILIVFFVFLMAKLTIPYFDFDYQNGFLVTKQAIQHIKIWNIAFYIHISTSIFVLFVGIFQFSSYVKKTCRTLHKKIGYLYVILILFFASPSGIVMGFYANGGFWAKLSFVILSFLWWYFTFKSLVLAKNQNYNKHYEFAVRSYALTLSAISLRLLVMILPNFFILNSTDMYALISWLSWGLNLAIAEIIIKWQKS